MLTNSCCIATGLFVTIMVSAAMMTAQTIALWHMTFVHMPRHVFIIGNNAKPKCTHINIIFIKVTYLAD